jgi:hypothetical protein
MTRFRVAPSTVIALLGVLWIASCDPCDPCDGGGEQQAAAGPAAYLAVAADSGDAAAR